MHDQPNYSDSRWAGRRAAGRRRFDDKRMVLLFTDDEDCEVELRAQYAVCSTCNGKGSHVAPNIDDNGISPERFLDDPDFAEDYFGGRFDVTCYDCGGLRVVPEPVEDELTDIEQLALTRYRDTLQADADYAAECAAERRVGA